MNSNDKKVRNIGIAVLLLMLITSVLFRGDVISESSRPHDGRGNFFQDMPLQPGSSAESGDLSSGESAEISIAEDGRIIKNMTAILSWDDENDPPGLPRLRRYENQPDQFSVMITAPDGNSTSDSGSNQIGETGTLELHWSVQDTILNDQLNEGTAGSGTWSIQITLVDTGMWTPQLGPGFIGLQDSGNGYSVSMEYEYYDISPEEES